MGGRDVAGVGGETWRDDRLEEMARLRGKGGRGREGRGG